MVWNQIKTALLLGALSGFFLFIGAYLGGQAGLVVAFSLALLMNFVSYFWSDKIVLFAYRAKEANPGDYPRLHQLVEEIAKKAKMPKPKVYVVPSANPNAFATGRNPNHVVVAVTNGILDLLNEKELKGVIAHEMSHVKNRDILIGSVAATIAAAISFVAMMARWAAIFGGMGGDRDGHNFLELLVLSILAPLIATVIRLAISRSREYLADETGAKLLGEGKGLASALKKLEAGSKSRPMRMGSETSAHMFIVNPFTASYLMKLFSTHPPVDERVKRLDSLKF